ncbi:LysR substrate-binding domain-containing protein [Pueribacillus sp. YX66]|uniref:LysR substrate-binding domain-containing protein n=1 Tax=Pueribacillus sp. YX66 TaxID=3229242 RepID=UPI00358D91B2
MDQQLQVFVTVVERENFSRAAEELHMTQPAVSQYIQSLERQMGTRLLERTNKYVRLNKAGAIVYHHAKEILNVYKKMHYLVDDLTAKATGLLPIGASYTFGEYMLPHIIAVMHDKYPLIRPTIMIGNTKEIVELVKNHQVEVGIVEGQLQDESLLIEPFATDEMVIFTSAQHDLTKTVPSRKLMSEETWIIRESGSGTRTAVDNMFRKLNITPKNVLEFGSTQLIKESVEAGVGISMLSKWAIRKELQIGTLTVLPIQGLPFLRKFSIVTKAPFQTKALELFIQLIKESTKLFEVSKT